jgi:hypothetical protein
LFKARRSALIAFLTFAGVAAIGVPINALYFQDGRHPAPLFSSHALSDPPLPPLRPAHPQQARTAAPKSDAQKTEAAEISHAEKPRDPISQLLAGGSKETAETTADKAVLFAQRALVKLGYPLRPDGVFGGSTRQAIEKFERSAGMPVKGELTPKILHRLAAKSKLPHD